MVVFLLKKCYPNNKIGMIKLNIIIRFFRDFLDGWIYVIYVVVCLFGILLCIKFLRRNNEEEMVTSFEKSISYEPNNSSTANVYYVDSSNDSSIHPKSPYSGDVIDDQK